MVSAKKDVLIDILNASKGLLEDEEGITSLEHQMHTRIYNNAFANLMMGGIHVEEDEKELIIRSRGCFRCPRQSIQTILRDHYSTAIENCRNISNHGMKEEYSPEAVESVFGITDYGVMADAFDHMALPEIKEDDIDVNIESDEKETLAVHDGKIRVVNFSSIYKRDNETDSEEDETAEDVFSVKPFQEGYGEEALSDGSELQKPEKKKGLFFLGKRKKESGESIVRNEESSVEDEFAFKPKTIDAAMMDMPDPYEDTPYEMPGKKEYIKPISKDTSHDGGELLMQRHMVTLSKRLGTENVGPYRFTFWPTSVPAGRNRTFADMLVHLVDDVEKSEQLFVLDKNRPEVTIDFEKKKLKVFGLWENGEFTAHIVPVDRTASMYEIKDEYEVLCPEVMDDTFLEQFRMEKKGQPKHFVVPFRENNHGEQNIPIIGYVEVKGVRHALKRMNGNTLRYSMDRKAKVISGHWEDGRFRYSVDADRV